MKIVQNLKRYVRRLIRTGLAAAVVSSTASPLWAQDGSFTYGRGPAPSGSAAGMMSLNRQGLGMSFRGGHVAGDTVGREQSISHIGLTPFINVGDGLFFGDTRLVRANEGGLAWSFGSGYRHYLPEIDAVLGGHGYFDRDQITGGHFQQWSIGAEILAHGWEARGNFYSPFGDSREVVGQRVDQTSVAFAGENISFTRIDTAAEALKGFDTEVGMLLPGELSEQFDLRAFGGAYHFSGDNIDGFTGWSARLQADVADTVELGLSLTDDEVFSTNVAFTATVHFGGFRSPDHRRRSAIQRFSDPVRRRMTMAVSTQDNAAPGQIAINPLTDAPFTVAHVDGDDVLGPFSGTIEDPFNSLTAGLGAGKDIVYVHSGSVFNALPDNTITLAAGQQVFGEGVIPVTGGTRLTENTVSLGAPLGDLQLPFSPKFIASGFSDLRPTLSGSAGNAVTLANDSQFSGFVVDSPAGHGIFSNGAERAIVRDVLINAAGGDGILLQNTLSTTSIQNTVIQNAAGAGLHLDGGTGGVSYLGTSSNLNPAWGHIENSAGFAVLVENMTGGELNMFGSTTTDTGGAGIRIQNNTATVSLDNYTSTASTANGIAIVNSGGRTTVRDSLGNGTTITTPAAEGLLVDGLLAGGTVSVSDLNINGRQDTGISVLNNSGTVTFTGDVAITNVTGGAAPGLLVSGANAGGATEFRGDLSVTDSLAEGILITGNATGSAFSVFGSTAVTNTTAAGIAITGDAGTTEFGGTGLTAGGTTVDGRSVEGISLLGNTGVIRFQNGAQVDNSLLTTSSGVDIQGNQATISFDRLIVNNAVGPTLNGGVLVGSGLNMQDNIAGADGTAEIAIGFLDVDNTGGTGVFGLNNTNITVGDGQVTTVGGRAVDMENSGINMSFTQVNSTASPDFGIRLVNTNFPEIFDFFQVTGDTATAPTGRGSNGSGGFLQGAGTAAVRLENAGQVRFQSVTMTDNVNGVQVINSGLAADDDQRLEIFFSEISNSDVRGIDALNLTRLDVQNSRLINNGDDAALGQQTIFMDYSELINPDTTERFDQWDNPFLVNLFQNDIFDDSTDAVVIRQQATAVEAHLGVNIDSNAFQLQDLSDPAAEVGTDPTGDTDRDDALIVFWNGPSRVEIENNDVTLNATDGQSAFVLDFSAPPDDDELDLFVLGNRVLSTATAGNPTRSIGLDLTVRGVSDSVIQNNNFDFAGGPSRGFELFLGPMGNSNLMDISFNTVINQTDGGDGILFESVSETSSFVINANNIGLFDTGAVAERGIVFQSVSGVVNLFGNQSNFVELGNPNTPGAGIETVFFINPAAANGTIIVNGAQVP